MFRGLGFRVAKQDKSSLEDLEVKSYGLELKVSKTTQLLRILGLGMKVLGLPYKGPRTQIEGL